MAALRARAVTSGLCPEVRRDAWRYLLGLHALGSTSAERQRAAAARWACAAANVLRFSGLPAVLWSVAGGALVPPVTFHQPCIHMRDHSRAPLRREEYKVLRMQWETIGPVQAARFSQWWVGPWAHSLLGLLAPCHHGMSCSCC